jgi:hypothetical protein
MSLVGPEGIITQSPVPVWRTGVGWASEYAFEGTREEVDAAVVPYAGTVGVIEIRYTELGGTLWRGTVVFAGKTREEAQEPPSPDSLVEVSWAFPRNDLQRDIWTHPRVEAQLARMPAGYRARFRADVEAWMAGTTTIQSPTGPNRQIEEVELSAEALTQIAVAFGASATEITAFFDVLTKGQSFYIFSRRVLRLQRVGPTTGQWWKANANTNRVYRRARLISELSPPDWVAFKMPDGYWFKHQPEEDQSGTRLTMVQEFEYFGADYSQFTYGAPL